MSVRWNEEVKPAAQRKEAAREVEGTREEATEKMCGSLQRGEEKSKQESLGGRGFECEWK